MDLIDNILNRRTVQKSRTCRKKLVRELEKFNCLVNYDRKKVSRKLGHPLILDSEIEVG